MLIFGVHTVTTSIKAQAAALAPTCPSGQVCVVFEVVNGIGVASQEIWTDQVSKQIANPFFTFSHSPLNPNYIRFDAVYNESFGKMKDIFDQSIFQWSQQDIDAFLANSSSWLAANPTKAIQLANAVRAFQFNLGKYSADLNKVVDRIHAWQNIGYSVILVGDSQGTFFTNEAYLTRLRDAIPAGEGALYPNPNRLSIVNFASAAGSVADGRQKYTTNCNDIIRFVPNSLPSNINEDGWLCVPLAFSTDPLSLLVDQVLVAHDINAHFTENTYMRSGTEMQRRIFGHFEDSLPMWNCNGDPNCYLRDNYDVAKDYSADWQLIRSDGYTGTGVSYASTTELLTPSVGQILQSVRYPSATGSSTASQTGAVDLTIRSRRVFTGPFTASFDFAVTSAENLTIGLYSPLDNTAVVAALYNANTSSAYPATSGVSMATPDFISAGLHKMTITKSDTDVKLYVDGSLWTNNATTSDKGYFLAFDLVGGDNVRVKNLTVYRGVTPPASGGSSTNGTTSGSGTKTLTPVFDGMAFSRQSTWQAARTTNAASWVSASTTTDGWGVISEYDNTTGNMYQVGQYHAGFDTSFLGTGATISFASLCVNMYYATSYSVDAEKISVFGSLLTAAPTSSDVNKTNGVELSSRTSVPVSNTASQVCFPLTSAGLSYINKTGRTVFSLRSSYDADNLTPRGRNLFGVSTSKSATPPTLKVVYTTSGSTTTTNTTAPVLVVPPPPPTAVTTKLNTVWDGAVFTRQPTWATARTTSYGNWVSSQSSLASSIWGVISEYDNTTGNMYQVGQYHMGYSMASLGSGATINSASACVNVYYPSAYRVDNQMVSVVGSSLLSSPTISDANKASSQEFSARSLIPNEISQGYVCFPLNSSGISALSKGGNVSLALRASGDLDNVSPRGRNLFSVYTSKSTTPPYLSVTYTPGVDTTPPPPPATGTVGVFVNGYNGSLTCSLNGSNVSAPNTFTNKPTGSYSISCTAPTGYYISGVSPSSATLSANATISFTVTVIPVGTTPLGGSCTANGGSSPLNVYVGVTTNFAAVSSGGTAPYHFMWTGANTNTADSPTAWFSTNYSGPHAVSVRITDSSAAQQVMNVDCPQLTILQAGTSPLTYVCTITPTPITLGQSSVMLVTASGGVAPYTWNLPGTPYFTAGNQSAVTVTPASRGLQTYQGFLSDSSGLVVKPTCSVQVN